MIVAAQLPAAAKIDVPFRVHSSREIDALLPQQRAEML